MLESYTNKLLILGVGNLILGDEGVGVHVVERLAKRQLPASVACLDGGTGGFLLLEPMQQAQRVVLIDAAAFDDPPGSVRKLKPSFTNDYPKTLMIHDLGLKDLLDSLQLMGAAPDILMIAITIDPKQTMNMELSPPVAKGALQAEQLVLEEIERFVGEQN